MIDFLWWWLYALCLVLIMATLGFAGVLFVYVIYIGLWPVCFPIVIFGSASVVGEFFLFAKVSKELGFS